MASFLVLMIVIGVSVWFGSLLGSWLAGKNHREESKKERETVKEPEIDIHKLPDPEENPRTELSGKSEPEPPKPDPHKTSTKTPERTPESLDK